LEEQGERGLAAGETAVEEADTRDDEPDDEGTEGEVDVVVFEAGILGIDVDFESVAAIGDGVVELGGDDLLPFPELPSLGLATVSRQCVGERLTAAFRAMAKDFSRS
jgi:hypothetical protein